MTQTFIADECCSKPLSKALLSGALDTADAWACPKCGMDWRPVAMPGDIRLWQPYVNIEVWRGRR